MDVQKRIAEIEARMAEIQNSMDCHDWQSYRQHTASPMSRNKFNFKTTYRGEEININYNVNGAKDKSVSLSANIIHS